MVTNLYQTGHTVHRRWPSRVDCAGEGSARLPRDWVPDRRTQFSSATAAPRSGAYIAKRGGNMSQQPHAWPYQQATPRE